MLLNNKELIILSEFSSDYHKKIYGRDIAKKLKMNQKTVSNLLKDLEKQHILKFETQGRNKYYFFNPFNENIKDIIKLIEIYRKIEFLEKHKKIKSLFLELEKRVKTDLIVFGSYAKGISTEKSDIDICILGKTIDVEELEKTFNIKINIVSSSRLDKNTHLGKEIISNHIILNKGDDLLELLW